MPTDFAAQPADAAALARVMPPATPPAPGGLAYDGRIGALYQIFFENLLLGIVTLGIYRFWGRTRYRRYLWSHTVYDGDRFEYTGTGGELFRGFLIAFGIFILLVLAVNLVELAAGAEHPIVLAAAQVALFAFIVVALFAARYTALRYRLTRTRWRGIRGGLAGSAWTFSLRSIWYGFLSLVTLGQFRPFATVRLAGYRLNNVFFGTAPARFAGRGRDVYGRYLASFLLALAIGAGIILLIAAVMLPSAALGEIIDRFRLALEDGDISGEEWRWIWSDTRSGGAFNIWHWLAAAFIGLFLAWPLLMLVVNCWYWSLLYRYLAGRTSIAGLAFGSDVTTGQLVRLIGINFLLQVFTLGLGYPVVLNRLWRFLADHLLVRGEIDGAVIEQSRLMAPRRGEGFLEVLDPGIV